MVSGLVGTLALVPTLNSSNNGLKAAVEWDGAIKMIFAMIAFLLSWTKYGHYSANTYPFFTCLFSYDKVYV